MMMTGSAGCLRLDLRAAAPCRFAGHADVGDQHLRLVERERLQHFVRGRERLVGDALARERLLEHPADRAVVVDDPHDLMLPSPRGGS